uniref:ADAM metallopeptidase with thrombospondin type 1 motif, 12 n=1 Tax=Mastacembelus armatus TaxID=205130 RepID=A0A7N8WV50_9TELE
IHKGSLYGLYCIHLHSVGPLSQSESDLSIVHPVKINADGGFISHSLSHHFKGERVRRDLRPLALDGQVYYKVPYKGRALVFSLTANNHLVSDHYILERRHGSANRTEHRLSERSSCHLLGTVEAPDVQGTAAISTCKGLKGFFSLPEGHYFIEPVQKSPDSPAGTPEPHIIYPRVTTESHRKKRSLESKETPSPCGVQGVYLEREEWEREQLRGEGQAQFRSKRSVSRERWVETMVVADSKLIEYHGSDNVESYIFTIMNMVAGIFHDASIGNAIHVVLVRLILLQGEEKGLKIVHHADTTLASFCAWQKNLNPQSDTHPAHHDLAVLVTRKDICAGMNQPCETLGLSHLSGLCQPHRSCNINEDSGLPVAFTIAHEMGHSFGIHHDGQGNDCELEGRQPFIMSRQLIYDRSPLTWSSCSKEYITRFLDRGWGFCLDDRPSKRDLITPLARLGIRYTTHHQCQLQYGPNATFCPEVDNVCQILWCSVNGSCRSKLDSPIDGTRCGPEKWCISGECVIVGKLPETVNGGWGQWSTWSHCSRTCGVGVQSAERECNNPKPQFGGKYCTGERRRYRTCNTKPCPQNKPTFREMLCSEFDSVTYHNELYKWIPVANPLNPCELHCRPVGEHFLEKMLDAVTDGTPCFMNNNSRNICINGVCKEVGCDYGIDSNAMEDRCGVCLGDGTSCETVYKSFDEEEGFGYVNVGVIPAGARDILVKEVKEAGNFLALKSEATEEYFLNGNYIIQWNGEYKAGGTTFYYERSGNMENLTAPGPTQHPVMLQLLFQEKNLGLKYEYTIKKSKDTENDIIKPLYTWKHGAWTDCSTTCGLGEQHQPVRCIEVDVGVVDESLCDPDSRPEERHRKCKNMDCPARWWVGGWQQCTTTCGSDGVKKRTVLCVRTVSGEERVLHPVECRHLLKPKPVVPCNRDVPCGQDWAVGNWEECPVTCGGGVRSRTVTCALAPKKPCNLSTKPRSRSLCALQSCPNSNLRRRPGPAPKYRRTYPPNSHPKRHHGSPTWAPIGTTDMIMLLRTGLQRRRKGLSTWMHLPQLHHSKILLNQPHRHHISHPLYKQVHLPCIQPEPPPQLFTPPHTPALKHGQRPPTPGHTGFPSPPTFTRATQSHQKRTYQQHKLLPQLQENYSPLQHPQVLIRKYPICLQCSTTCGIGAIWRTVTCSSGNDEDCAKMKKPEPARTCHLQPCATWQSGSWSKCPGTCAVAGRRYRDVQCVDSQSKRALRPFHCQAVSSRPLSTLTCPPKPCMTWSTSPWGPCSGSCGSGIRERLVYCPEPHRCSTTLKPNSTEPCSLKPCTRWKTEHWKECSASCGGGTQQREVDCVSEQDSAVVPNSLCEKTSKPETLRKCNMQECPVCKRNTMSSRFCDKLKLLGRCSLRSVQRQCCITSMLSKG